MADHPRSIVVVGAGLAAAEAVRVLREEEAYSGAVTLLGAEAHRPYERPPLSKDYLQGACDRQSAFVHAQSWYDEHDVDLRLGTEAAAINRSASEVLTVDGDRFAYDRLLLCTGAEPRRLDVPGADLPGVRLLRTLEDGDALKEAFARVHRVVIIGAG